VTAGEPETAAPPQWAREAAPARDNGTSAPPPLGDNGTSAPSAAPASPEAEPLPFTPAPQGEPRGAEAEEESARPIRRGWWQRRFT
jgi:hypothetical protein